MSDATQFCKGRHAGLLLPLFSAVSQAGWGIGEIPDLVTLARWQQEAGLDFLLMLPVNEMPANQQSPYSTLTAMAIDPIYVRLAHVPEFVALGGEAALSADQQARLRAARAAARVDYGAVRALKDDALRACFARFDASHRGRRTKRARAFAAFCARDRGWLDDYALFRALRDRYDGAAWWTWPAGLANRDPAALSEARTALAAETRFYAYVQWLADDQWHTARQQAAPVRFFGDLPFMVGADSADVWANAGSFARDLSVGTPPDAFSATGQDWGLPAYRWDVVVREDFRWLRARATRGTELYDGFRIDHVIGFYRTWVRDENGTAWFTPADESDQRQLGRRILTMFQQSGACIVAEDLGTVPDFLRESLIELDVPGYKVFRWERAWRDKGQPFRDPRRYAPQSVVTSGTHDTDTLADWWDTAPPGERQAVCALPAIADAGVSPLQPFDDRLRDALLTLLYEAGSNLMLLPIQDVFGWRDRVNVPATVGEENWSWRLPFPVESMQERDDCRERAAFLRRLAVRTARG